MLQQNSTKITFFLWLLKVLKFLYPKGNVHRFEETIKLIARPTLNSSNKSSKFVYSGITYKPWYDSNDYNILKFISDTLKNGFNDIEDECMAYYSPEHSVHSIVPKHKPSEIFGESFKDKDESWKYNLIWTQGKFSEAALSLFPKTVNIVTKLKPFIYPLAGEVAFLVMEPGVVIPPHADSEINLSLNCHFGIKTPEGCGIKVGGETRSWTKGETLFFDNSFTHEAWNKGQEKRVVLILDVFHPELTKIEKTLLKLAIKDLNLLGIEGGHNGTQDLQYLEKLLNNLK